VPGEEELLFAERVEAEPVPDMAAAGSRWDRWGRAAARRSGGSREGGRAAARGGGGRGDGRGKAQRGGVLRSLAARGRDVLAERRGCRGCPDC
jgi:hypothetical protein